MSLTSEDHASTYAYLRELESTVERAAPEGVVQGSIGFGGGGPVYLDAFRSKRAPTPSELVNAYKAVAFACININANAVTAVPLRLYCKTGRGEAAPRFWPSRRLNRIEQDWLMRRLYKNRLTRGITSGKDHIEEICDHPFLDVLQTPNEHFDGNTLIQHLSRTLDVVGTAYWFPERTDETWTPSEIWPLHSQYCYPVKGTGRTLIQDYTYFGDRFAFNELIRFRFVSIRDHYLSGFSPLHACFEQLGLIDYYTAVVESTLKGGARPEGLIGPKDPKQPWSKEERKRIETDVNNRFGRGNQGRIWAVDGSFDFEQLSYPPADLAGLAISKDARLLAANCFDVPMSMLENESSNKATASEGTSQHQRNAVEPRLAIIASKLTDMVRKIDPRLFIAADDAVQKDRTSEAKIHKTYLDTRVITRNEARADLGLEPIEGGDEFDQPKSKQPDMPGGDKAEKDE